MDGHFFHKKQIIKLLDNCLNKTLGEVDKNNVFERAKAHSRINGIAGDVIEQSVLGYPADNRQEPDLNIDGVKSIECDIGYQSVDMKLVNDIEKGDLVISQDYGVAVISLSKEAYVLDLKGNRITNDNIDLLLYQKYINNKNRKQRIKTVNPKKRSKDDDNKLLFNIEKILIDHN